MNPPTDHKKAHLDHLRRNPPDILSLQELAIYLSCSLRHAAQLTRDGQIPSVQLGRRRIVRRVDLLAALENGLSSRKPTREGGEA